MNSNPFRTEGGGSAVKSAVMIIFGATGDLCRRKLVPGLFDLACEGLLPVHFSLIGVSHTELTTEEFRDELEKAVLKSSRHASGGKLSENHSVLLKEFLSNSDYLTGSFEDSSCYSELQEKISVLESKAENFLEKVFYFSTAPRFFSMIAGNLSSAGLTNDEEKSRLVVEKPFGHDLQSAQELNKSLLKHATEKQIYRIDHYLGKETVQNILVFRFGNGIFEPLWNHKYIDHVEITVAESVGVGRRAGYFDKSGIVRDIIQNHLLQLLCLTALEPPVDFGADSVRDEKVKVLKAIKRIPESDVEKFAVRARYQSGYIAGEGVDGYLAEEGVGQDSVTETYASMVLEIDNWRWAGVPFFIRSGKRLPKKITDISIFFKNVPHRFFGEEAVDIVHPNVLSFQIQPDEGISLRVGCKPPGPNVRIEPVKMDFNYGAIFGGEPPSAYERLLLDSLKGDPTLFTRSDEIEESWKVVDPVLKTWRESQKVPVYGYEAGSWGPRSAIGLIESRLGAGWRRL